MQYSTCTWSNDSTSSTTRFQETPGCQGSLQHTALHRMDHIKPGQKGARKHACACCKPITNAVSSRLQLPNNSQCACTAQPCLEGLQQINQKCSSQANQRISHQRPEHTKKTRRQGSAPKISPSMTSTASPHACVSPPMWCEPALYSCW